MSNYEVHPKLPVLYNSSSHRVDDFGKGYELSPLQFRIECVVSNGVGINTFSSANYVVKLYSGGAGSEVFWGECAFTRDTNQVRGSQVPIQGPPVPANTRISASLSSGADDGETVAIKVYTHEYPA